MDVWEAYYRCDDGKGTVDSAASRVAVGCVDPRRGVLVEANAMYASVSTQQGESFGQVTVTVAVETQAYKTHSEVGLRLVFGVSVKWRWSPHAIVHS